MIHARNHTFHKYSVEDMLELTIQSNSFLFINRLTTVGSRRFIL